MIGYKVGQFANEENRTFYHNSARNMKKKMKQRQGKWRCSEKEVILILFLKDGSLTNKLMHFEEGLGNSTLKYYSLTDPLFSKFS